MKIAILGAGPGGYVAALKAAQMGAEVVVIEESEVGGVCLNAGCIPTKTLIASSDLYSKLKEHDDYGIEISGDVKPNIRKMMERKRSVISTQVKGIRALFKSWGIRLIEGRGSFISGKEIKVTLKDTSQQVVNADKFIIATGSRPFSVPAFPFDGTHILSSTHALELEEIPKSMIIIGAGVIGCEFASMYRALGCEVSIVELLPRALATEDEEISSMIEKEFKKRKIKLYTKVKAEKVVVEDNMVKVTISGDKELSAQKLLVSVGRSFNSEGLGLETCGVDLAKRGNISVNKYMQTTNPDIYAIGDVTGGILLAHVASKEGIVAVENILGHTVEMNYKVVPAGVFTHPEIGSVGLREHEAKEQSIKYKTGYFQYRALGKSHAIGEITGMFKVIAEAEGKGKILGAHVIGHAAADLIHEAVIAMQGGLTVKELADTIHSHPTLSEGMMEACEDLLGSAIHSTPKK
ncbi:MAG: dihydrolipoyl dehydrogenase [Candidatus Magnetoovum sp. WYHC-5]|nr:dihydrolipoyl dehydrogenase [Candidatus Magnetoovum sp. WYHC-5]